MEKKLTLPPPRKKGRRSEADKEALHTALLVFADGIKIIQKSINEKVSSRGWAYLIENFGLIDKSQFDYVQGLINECRKNGMLPLDFVAADEARAFKYVEELDIETKTAVEYINGFLRWIIISWKSKDDVTFWKTQTHYIQMMVEKIDVLNLFKHVCQKYHIPIANAKGWSDLISRGKIAKRYKEAEEMGLIPVFLYFGDFDPVGLQIVERFRKNMVDIQPATGWNPKNLIIDHFGLTYDFIMKHNLLWIDNLISGSGKPPDKKKEFIRDYIAKYGERKVEANIIITMGRIPTDLCEETIWKYLGDNPTATYDKGVAEEQKKVKELMDKVDFAETINELIKNIKEEGEDE